MTKIERKYYYFSKEKNAHKLLSWVNVLSNGQYCPKFYFAKYYLLYVSF